MKSSPILTGVAKWANRYGGYLLAAALSWGAATVRFLMTKQLENQSRMLLFIPVVMISAWYGGVGPGIFAILAGGILTAWVLIPPVDSLNIGSGPDQMEMLVYLFIGIGIVYLVHMERAEKKVREAAQAELEASNRSLEDRVKARTHELEVANRELEGFCYNVSHDLRTPTRSIIGNARILLDDFGGELSPPIRTKLERISSSAAKLGDFVDALLVYARLAKADLKKEVVCLNDILQTEAELNERHTGKRTTVKLDSQILIYGDRKLIEAAVEAVVSNTSKYAKLMRLR